MPRSTIAFEHDPEHQRYAQSSPSGVTLYLSGMGVLAERFGQLGGPQRWTNYLMVGGRLVGIHVENADETTLTRYFHTDHLGSIAVITNEAGQVAQRLSYDAWGLRRHPDGTPDPSGAIQAESTRGFTGHEHLAEVGLIHMNGRVYDPLLARFGTPDPMTEDPYSTQGWNRYSYVGNSPLNFTDPSGYCFMGCFWKPAFAAIGKFFSQNWGAILQIAATAMCGGNPACGAIVAGVTSAVVVGVSGGSLGDALRAGFISAATVAAMWGVGELTSGLNGVLTPAGGHGPLAPGSEAHLFNIAGHALVGCARAVASRASCGSGALAGAIGPTVAPALLGQSFQFRLVANSVMGGLASVAGGGTFGNGATTAAFGYLFNQEGDQNDRHKEGMDAARRDLEAKNFTVGPGQAVMVEDLEESRVYDLMARNKATGQLIGIEVKTTIGEIIFLKESQVKIDAIVATRGGWTTLDQRVSGVSYYTYCYNCPTGFPELQSALLYFRLQFSGVMIIPGKLGR